MKKLKITKKEDYKYFLEDEIGNKYDFNMSFLDIAEEIGIGDYIVFSDELLNPKYEGYSKMYTFGDLESKYGKNNISLTDIDVIKVVTKDKEIYLKRLYG